MAEPRSVHEVVGSTAPVGSARLPPTHELPIAHGPSPIAAICSHLAGAVDLQFTYADATYGIRDHDHTPLFQFALWEPSGAQGSVAEL
jgi:hypothetical protein